MAEKIEVLVSVDDAHADRVAAVAEELRGAGLDAVEALPELGTITGRADPAAVETLARVTGVASLERGREARIAPPDSDVQ